jgi:hypothetical protein
MSGSSRRSSEASLRATAEGGEAIRGDGGGCSWGVGKKAQGQGLRRWIAKFAVFDKIRGYTSLSKCHSQGIHGLKHRVLLKERSWGLVPMNRGVSRLPVCDTFWHLTFTMLRRCSQSIFNKKTAF